MTKGHVTREMESAVLQELREHPVVVLEGARQVGKTTLAKLICEQLNGRYFTLDDPVVLDELRDDPHLIGDGSRFTVVDEIQLLPKLVRVVKLYADERDRPGLFLVTGSSDRFGNKATFDPLTGRMSNFVMRPFSQCELSASQGSGRRKKAGSPAARGFNLIDAILDGRSPPHGKEDSVERLVTKGGYPWAQQPSGKKNAMERYLHQEVFQAARAMGKHEGIEAKKQLCRRFASNIGNVRNIAEQARRTGETDHLTKQMHAHLSDVFLIEQLPSFRERIRDRKVVRKGKLYFNDSGLATTMLQLDGTDLAKSERWGALLENFVLAELRKHKELSSLGPMSDFCFFREHRGIEVDIVLDMLNTNIAFEVNAASKLISRDRKNLVEFKEHSGDSCLRAIVFYCGERTIKYEDGTEAWPISSLLKPW